MLYIFNYSIWPDTATGNRFLSFLKGFDELGVEARVVLLTSFTGFKIQEQYQHIKVEYLWYNWPFARRVFNYLHKRIAFNLFLKRLKREDVVFCFGSPAYLTRFVERGIRVFHERTEIPDVEPIADPKKQEAYLESCKKLEGLFVISNSLRSYFINIGVPVNRIHIVNMTVDSNRFLKLSKKNISEKYIAYCGTASNNKDGVDELIKAFSLVTKSHPDIKLYIIGRTPTIDDKVGNIKLIKDLGLQASVVFTGVISASEMPQILKDALVLALDRPDSPRAQNGFPTKLGEYLLTENPVVVTKVGDIPLFLHDGESALLADQRSPEQFAQKICWAIDHPEEAAVIGKKGKEVALREFNYLKESKKIIDIIYGENTRCR